MYDIISYTALLGIRWENENLVVINIKESFLTQYVVLPHLQGLNNTIELLIVGTIVQLGINKTL